MLIAWNFDLTGFKNTYGIGESKTVYWERDEFGPGFIACGVSAIVGTGAYYSVIYSDESPKKQDKQKDNSEYVNEEPEQISESKC